MAFPINPQGSFGSALPVTAFNNLITWASPRMNYMKGYQCPCSGAQLGSPNPDCDVCFGRGFYWDPALGPFNILVTLTTFVGRNVNMGESTDVDYGLIYSGHPIITIPSSYQPLWQIANTNDIFVQIDAISRFQADLRVNQNQTIPAWHILGTVCVEPTGAVTVEDPSINQPVSGVAYTVSGGTITLNPNAQYPSGYPTGTSYVVEYTSPVVFVINEPQGGLVHTRPFGQGLAYPRRFKVSLLDLWLRSSPIGSSTDIGQNG